MLQSHNGTSFVDVPIYKHNGTTWVEAEVYGHNGSEWVLLAGGKQTYTKTWTAVWSQPYDEDNSQRSTGELWQGWNGTAYHGSQRSLIGFDTGQIKKELEGATITSCTVKFYSKHSWYSTCTYRIGYHNHSSVPTTFSHTKAYQHDVLGGKPSWASFSAKALAEGIRDGIYKGISFFAGTSKDQNYYGYAATHSSSNAPTITITYEK